MRLKTIQGVPVKPENWRSMVRAHLNGEPIPEPIYDAPDAGTLEKAADAGGFQDGAGGNPYSRGRVRHGKKASSMAMVAWHENWAREALRVLKPGGHLLVFGGSRTYHSMAMGVELAGFEIRDQIQWVYGQGFPKSMNVGKAIDKAGGVNPEAMASILRERREISGITRDELAERVGCTTSSIRDWEEGRSRAKGLPLEFMVPSEEYRCRLAEVLGYTADERRKVGVSADRRGDGTVYGIGHSGELTEGGNTPASKQWDGWGTALKPAHEPIVMARKPLKGTVASNVLEHGTGAINVDGCRIPGELEYQSGSSGMDKRRHEHGTRPRNYSEEREYVPVKVDGRWPANFIHDGSDEATEGLGAASRFFASFNESDEEWLDRNLRLDPATTAEPDSYRPNGPVASALARAVTEAVPGVTQSSVYRGPSTTATATEFRHLVESSIEAILSIASEFSHERLRGVHFQTRNRATAVVERTPTGTIQTTIDRWRSNGSAEPVTFSITLTNSEHGEADSPSRFMYCAKPSKAEKNAGLGEDFETKQAMGGGGTNHEELGGKFGSIKAPAKNHHPTVKPVALMAYLCRLVTPPGGTVLDPFLGSGTTGVAAVSEGFDFIGIEREAEYAAIAEARIGNVTQ